MEQPVNAVTGVVAHHAVAVRLDVLLDDVADLAEALTRPNDLDGLRERLVRHLHQVLVLFGHVANEERLVQIAVEVAMVHGHVDIAQIAILFEK